MQYQRAVSAGRVNYREQQQVKELLQNSQRLLEPITVRNPYAEQLLIPAEVFKPRRTNAHYLQFIEAVTFYHQYQREKHTDTVTGEVFIQTTLEDISEANKLMKEVLLRKADELNGATRNYFEQLKQLLQQQQQSTFTNTEIRKALRLPGTTVRRYHSELLQNGYIKLQQSKKKQGYLYEIVSYEEYLQLQNSISVILDEILSRLKTTEPPLSQHTSGSMKRKPTQRSGAFNR